MIPSAPPALVRTIDPAEQTLVANVKTVFEASGEATLKDSVEINSGTQNRPGVLAMADFYQKRFESLGMKVSREDMASVGRGCHLIAEHVGDPKAPRFMLIGHMDTVFEPSSGFLHYTNLGNGKVAGPGVSDMKGGNLVMLTALEALRRSGELDKMNVTVVLTGDEELPGADADGKIGATRKRFIAIADKSDIALAFEPTNGYQPAPIVARRGVTSWSLKVSAPTGHSSLIFSKDMGPGAVFPLATILAKLYEKLSLEPLLTFNVGNIAGGASVQRTPGKEDTDATVSGKSNVISPIAEVRGDLRAISPEQVADTQKKMQDLVTSTVADINARYSDKGKTSASIAFKELYPTMPPTAGNQKLLATLSRVNEDLGLGPLAGADPITQGAGDVSFAAGHAKATLDGLGPDGFDYHTVNETTTLPSIMLAATRAALMMHRLNATSAKR